ncbi:MAG: DUF4080 domain-containing protein [Phycisphaerales bacterium]|nr:DUF4080 domain-containing protein [Phycisphaerales bacterium]
MPEIVLATLNARYAHASFALRYLMANLGDLRDRSATLEFDISQGTTEILEAILALQPRILGLGVYIWNAAESLRLVADLKRAAPHVTIILGGPEVSYETDQQAIVALADYTITGEADLAFAALCRRLLGGERPLLKVIPADLPEFDQLTLPYDLYDERDIAHRVIYVEASRGCPFKCEFCLSSLDVPLRHAPLDRFLAAMAHLLDRGVRQFKFVDRTFNLNLKVSRAILDFFLERYVPGMFLHFEMIPDRLPEALREPIRAFPPGALQFEVGIQTLNPEVEQLISRRQEHDRIVENLRFLREETGVHVHADLIAGLPGEDVASFAAGFDQLVALRPQEIQVGLLKRLRGTPIVRHDAAWEMVYSASPPYEVLQTKLIDLAAMQRLRRFARYWDMIANSGNFIETLPVVWGPGSPFAGFAALSDALHAAEGRAHGISLHRLVEIVWAFLIDQRRLEPAEIAPILWRDYARHGRSDVPPVLRPHLSEPDRRAMTRPGSPHELPARQARHLAAPAAPGMDTP